MRFLLFALFCLFVLQANHKINHTDFVFENISIDKGLSSRIVYCIVQDKPGFLWFGTDNGLNRYDGYNFKVFKNNPNNSFSISNSTINCCLRTKDNVLWFGTNQGLNVYNPVDETFSRPIPVNDSLHVLSTERIRVLYEDKDELLWIGTQNGLYKYDRESNRIDYFSFQGKNQKVFNDIIRSIYEDWEGNFWIGTFDGLFKLNTINGSYRYFRVKTTAPSSIPNNLVLDIQDYYTEDNELWIATEAGLCLFNTSDGSFNTYNANTDNKHYQQQVKKIFRFKHNQLLLGTDDGLMLFDTDTKQSTSFLYDKENNLSIIDNVVWSIYKDNSGVVWFGTNNGISKINTRRKNFEITSLSDKDTEVIVNNMVIDDIDQLWISTFDKIICRNTQSNDTKNYLLDLPESKGRYSKIIFLDSKGHIWAGTNNGLLYWNKTHKRFIRVINNEFPLLIKYIFGITEDDNGNIWININNGLCKITPEWDVFNEPKNFQFEFIYLNNLKENKNEEISNLLYDGKNSIWFSIANEGVFNYNLKQQQITNYKFEPGNRLSILSNNILSIFLDKKKNIYFLTDRGVCVYDEQRNNFKNININAFNEYALINGVADNHNNLWMTSHMHLFFYNTKTHKTISFDFTHELANKGFVMNSIYKHQNGKIYIGSYDRYICFDPAEILHEISDSIVKPPVITNVNVFDKAVNWNRYYADDPAKEETLKLTYKENYVKINFSLLNNYEPTNNKYSYMLAGVDKQWTQTSGISNYATYSNLLPGTYTFIVQAANPDGFWSNESTRLKIIIAPPWWKTVWAYLAYGCVVMVVLWLFYKIIRTQYKLAQQLKKEKIEHEKNEEINAVKLRFFTNITHEFRTPLTLILGPIETLLEKITSSQLQEQLLIMKSNAERLLRLINQIMDFRKIQTKKIELQWMYADIVPFVKSIFDLFTTHAAKRKIEFSFHTACKQQFTSFDNDKMEKVIFNLLSNAFKFTPKDGSITVDINKKTINHEIWIEISIRDNGIGLKEGEEKLIFERFYQSTLHAYEEVEGSGIGLTLCKEYVELHHGNIEVRNNNGEGVTFTVLLPIKDELNQPKDITDDIETPLNKEVFPEKQKLLLIEDNTELRNYLLKNLEDTYEVYESGDGLEGLDMIKTNMPDIIISDLMMPKMNGLELCEKVKSNMATSHIPFILLTAKVNEEATFEGYAFGADDYITKPFSMKLLKVRIVNLLERKLKLQEYYRLNLLSHPQTIKVESRDEKFMYLLVKTIDENIDNFDLDIELVCSQLNLSHQQVYRKIKNLTGQSLNEFIRSVRMKRAAQLLIDSDLNISEIMYSVGFSNSSYFSKCFIKEFQLTPKEYRLKNKPENEDL
ncbi:MAG: ATP-binding protein [Pigmentiphaga sp.]|nr:ATP-binding protein [Pigmentiphaga sp.]